MTIPPSPFTGTERAERTLLGRSRRPCRTGGGVKWLMIPILIAAFWLGARSLDSHAVWSDELHSIQDAGGDPAIPLTLEGVWHRVSVRNPWHSPGYFLILHVWGGLTGWQPATLRALSLLFGLLAIACTYRLGQDMASARVGLFAALVLASSAFFVHYLYELRVYTLMALLALIAVWIYLRLVNSPRPPSRWLWLALFATVVGLFYSHYLATVPLLGIAIYHLLFVPKNRRWWQVVGVGLAGGALFLPWVPYLLTGVQLAEGKDLLHERALRTPEAFASFLTLFSHGVIVLMLGLIIAAVTALRRARNLRLIVVVAAVTLVALLAINQVMMIMHEGRLRYLITLWPLGALIIAAGIMQLRRWRTVMLAALALWVGIGVWTTLFTHFTANLDGSAYTFPMQLSRRVLIGASQPGDAVVNVLGDSLGAWMYAEIEHYYYDDLGVTTFLYERPADTKAAEAQHDNLTTFLGQRPRAWVVYAPDPPPSTLADARAQVEGAAYALCGTSNANSGVAVELYARTPVCCGPEFAALPPLARFGDGVVLTGLDLSAGAKSGVTLPIMVGWQGGNTLPADSYSVAMHLVDSTGTLVAQADTGLPAAHFRCESIDLKLDQVPPGHYTLQTGVYNWHDGARLPGTLGDAAPVTDLLPVAQVVVSS